MLRTIRERLSSNRTSPSPRLKRLASAAGAMATLLVAGTVETQDAVANGDTRSLSMVHEHTGETLNVTFKRDGRYDRAALDQINWLMRDWRENESIKMDPRLFDVVWEAQRSVGSTAPLRIVCGYRSPKTNGMLRRRSSGVADTSQHMLGKAMDFFMTDASIDQIRAVGMRMQRGGVGWYPRSGSPFVHLDVGSVRSWPRMSHDQLARLFPDGKTVHLPANGKPLARYEEARAEILSRGGTVLGYTALASADEVGEGPGLKGFFASLFGGSGGTDAPPAALASAAIPSKARAKPSIAVASADPTDGTGAMAYAAPAASEALRTTSLRRDGASAKELLTGEADQAVVAPLPPRRPSEFAVVATALTIPLPPQRPVQLASLNGEGLGGMVHVAQAGNETANEAAEPTIVEARLVPADADPREQVRSLFFAAVQGVSEPAAPTALVRVALARPRPDEALPAEALHVPSVEALSGRFSAEPLALSATRFTGSATQGPVHGR
ncbi:DUF882 domain-containing protein [Methylorubrum extorquens]|uniref:DUF882 domain-containing protein n=1 Tax=Methylorubrum extorquens TaxID=408 RepID=UPI000158F1D9|nr:DUF882 domain-containing protein [Methylorubrum extorquens]ABY31142.1 protein of unknown function DUF882 [Methylorubrum extorquens PA1]KQP87852.1 peptidase domain containing protein [Methylobacterium sp. Leaf119]WIU37789.1 DUF882 domain-containing protein [Methylorubrum extorquens]